MRITFLLASLWLSGGERIIIEIANRLSQNGHKVVFVLPHKTYDPEMLQLVSPTIEIRHTQMAGARHIGVLNGILLTVELAAAVPPSDIILTTFTPTTPAGWISSRLQKKGWLVWLHQDFPEMFEARPLYKKLSQIAPKWHDLILTVSHSLKEEIETYRPKAPVVVIGEALSQDHIYRPISVEERLSHKSEKFTILYLGDHRPRKGLADFLAASEIVYKHHSSIELWLAIKDSGEINTTVPYRCINRPTNQELAKLFATCDLFVSSTWREGFGVPPLEAMACGAPVVMTDSGGGREYARNEENCLVVPPRAPEKLADAMIQVIEKPSLALKFRNNGPLTAARFNWDSVISRMEAALGSLHTGPKSRQ
jgi:glycosyltransferase involved in cell wall biosynthesis